MKLSDITERKFTEIEETSKYSVLTEDGYVPVISSNKTIEYKVYDIKLEDGYSIQCADTHILIDKDYNEVYAIDSLGIYIRTKTGNKKVLSVTDLGYEEEMYDLSIDSEDKTYYTNDILSHNTVTVATYLLWVALFQENKNIGIAANVQKLAVEVLDKIKKIYLELPVWLQPGISVWNKQSVEFNNGIKILTSATSSDSFRGYSIHCINNISKVTVRDKVTNEIKECTIEELNDELAGETKKDRL